MSERPESIEVLLADIGKLRDELVKARKDVKRVDKLLQAMGETGIIIHNRDGTWYVDTLDQVELADGTNPIDAIDKLEEPNE